MRQFEPKPNKVIKRGSDPLGDYWQVFYEWSIGGQEFSFGSQRVMQELLPEDKYVGEISEVVFEHVDYMIASYCSQVDMITTADGGWTVKTVKRSNNGLYQEKIKTFYDFNEAVAFVKGVKYPVLTGATYNVETEEND